VVQLSAATRSVIRRATAPDRRGNPIRGAIARTQTANSASPTVV